MTTTCVKWSSFRHTVEGHGEFRIESDSDVSSNVSWEPSDEHLLLSIMSLIRQKPGIRTSEIARMLAVDDSRAFHLVDVLHDKGLVGHAK